MEMEFEEAPIRLYYPDGPVIGLTNDGKAIFSHADGEWYISKIWLTRWDDDMKDEDSQLLQHEFEVPTDSDIFRALRDWVMETCDVDGMINNYKADASAREGDMKMEDMEDWEMAE